MTGTSIRKKQIRVNSFLISVQVREPGWGGFGHDLSRDSGYIGQRMLAMELPGRGRRRTPEKIYGSSEREHGDDWFNSRTGRRYCA